MPAEKGRGIAQKARSSLACRTSSCLVFRIAGVLGSKWSKGDGRSEFTRLGCQARTGRATAGSLTKSSVEGRRKLKLAKLEWGERRREPENVQSADEFEVVRPSPSSLHRLRTMVGDESSNVCYCRWPPLLREQLSQRSEKSTELPRQGTRRGGAARWFESVSFDFVLIR